MNCPIAIVGMACRYPDAQTVGELFENSAAQRRSFRVLPDSRLNSQYFDESGRSPDRSYARQAAVIGGFVFDRERFRVSRSSYDATDLTHWLALTVAREAVEDIQFRRAAAHVGNEAVRVVVGNTLTGEFSRVGTMRIRWPYVRGVVSEQMRNAFPDLDRSGRDEFLRTLEDRYKRAFVVPNEDYLAGGLSNTIAGRICNHFDFKGGGYSVDGACCSSLLAVTDACSALAAGDADMVLAGGVDLSLDPFELVGFSRSAALARNEMFVYDEESQGFWPGEGCGFVALMRYADALERCDRIHGVIHGWGISSDGRGGLTRPEPEGQRLALRRCYSRAGYGIETAGYFEGHGTGTKIGDGAELRALIDARRASGQPNQPAVISSIKANIGHTKAAAGLAGLIRATLCIQNQIIPPTTACRRPHRYFSGEEDNLMPSDRALEWEPAAVPRRAGISAMGFGGINSHIAIEEVPAPESVSIAFPASLDTARFAGAQDCELFLFAAVRPEDLAWTINHVASFAGQLSLAEMTDLAMELGVRATRGAWTPWNAAIVARTPAELQRALGNLAEKLETTVNSGTDLPVLSFSEGIFLSRNQYQGRLGFIFSGQAAPVRSNGAAWARRFESVRTLYEQASLSSCADQAGTGFAQPAIVAASLAGLEVLDTLGISADLAIGHSLGELTALHWAGCFDRSDLVSISKRRGRAMADDPCTSGAMAAVGAGKEETLRAIGDRINVLIAGSNSPRQTVVAGPREDIGKFVAHSSAIGISATLLPVAQAFHTPAMAPVAEVLKREWQTSDFRSPEKLVISTVTGRLIPPDTEIADHLARQITSPVDFLGAIKAAANEVDLFVEVGPGELFANLARDAAGKPAVSVDAAGSSFASLLLVAGAAHVLNRAPQIGNLFRGRFARRFNWDWRQNFFTNPCESIPTEAEAEAPSIEPPPLESSTVATTDSPESGSTRDRLCSIVAERTGLPAWTLEGASRMMSDLHLNSITVGEIVAQLATSIGLPPLVDPTEYADASIDRIAAAFDQIRETGGAQLNAENGVPAGLGNWVRFFKVDKLEAVQPLPASGLTTGTWEGFGSMGSDVHALLERLNRESHGNGVIVWMGANPGLEDLEPLLQSAHRAIDRSHEPQHRLNFVVIQQRPGAAGFARSFFLENPSVSTLVINISPEGGPSQAAAILSEIDASRTPFMEVFLNAESGGREEPRLNLIRDIPPVQSPLSHADVVLVTGGGRGIAAECAFRLALENGCSLLILGRSSPSDAPDLAANLARMRDAGLRVAYRQADVIDRTAIAEAVASGAEELGGEVTGLIHGAGLNLPRMVANLTPVRMEATIAPKVEGLKHALAAVDSGRLKLLATFSSIIGRMGLPGEADYALANEWLSLRTDEFQIAHPACRCRAIEWSVWSGVGMGQRLGRVDILARQGIAPISIDDGVREFLRVINTPDLPVRVVVSGRYGTLATISADTAQPYPFRFLESIPVYYPGIELIADSKVSPETDPYLNDHQLNGERLFPAVLSLEAMAQAAVALMTQHQIDTVAGSGAPVPRFSDVKFRKAIVVPGSPNNDFSIRIVALAETNDELSLAIRCSGTAFLVNHVEARCAFKWRHDDAPAEPAKGMTVSQDDLLPVDPDGALYRNALFQKGRFQRVSGYRLIEARRCSAEISTSNSTDWFSADLPQTFLLGDPGARDAALHAVQACIPHKIVIPTSATEIVCGHLEPSTSYRIAAAEVEDRGNELIYDVAILGPDGSVKERWKNITLRLLSDVPDLQLNSLSLMVPFVERKIAAILPQAELKVRLERGAQSRWQSARPSSVHYRPDGKPDPSGPLHSSAAWHEDWRLSVESMLPVGCDLQSVSRRPASDLLNLLGQEGFELASAVSAITSDPLDCAAIRVWSTREALKKCGLAFDAPLTLDPDSSKQWTVFHSGASFVFSSLVQHDDGGLPVCIALALTPVAAPELAPIFWTAGTAEARCVGSS